MLAAAKGCDRSPPFCPIEMELDKANSHNEQEDQHNNQSNTPKNIDPLSY
ncbi:MAG: hypothetical protein F6J90_38110 [Moorea sp. SIOASIH]|nr:hypothetical protein [Moorena sp. SIOASIH]NEO41830.1 hypothetical protein [Moorena sp. SIOASIH]